MTELSAVADSDDRFKNDSQRQQMVLFSKNFMNYITSAILKLFMGSSWVFLGLLGWINGPLITQSSEKLSESSK